MHFQALEALLFCFNDRRDRVPDFRGSDDRGKRSLFRAIYVGYDNELVNVWLRFVDVCSVGQFQCTRGIPSCVGAAQQCDGSTQCLDSSDESNCRKFLSVLTDQISFINFSYVPSRSSHICLICPSTGPILAFVNISRRIRL